MLEIIQPISGNRFHIGLVTHGTSFSAFKVQHSNLIARCILPASEWRCGRRMIDCPCTRPAYHVTSLKRKEECGALRAQVTDVLEPRFVDEIDRLKAGGADIEYVRMQSFKSLDQPKIATKLEPLELEGVLDLAVIGCGPAGLSLAAEAAKRGLNVGLVGLDVPFVNTYGVWEDEFEALGLESCIEHTWPDAAMFFNGDKPFLLGRAYGRVDRNLLREELLRRCSEAGVRYLDAEVEEITDSDENSSTVICVNGRQVHCRLVSVASGAAAGRFLKYEKGGPSLSVQTAYGMEVEVKEYPYDPSIMVFMDYRDYKPMVYEKNDKEIPTFLYAMPSSSTRVFFEETCLAARPAMSFDMLKQRLKLRLKKLGIEVLQTYEEEWSYIPVGGTLPDTAQQHLGFGAAASMVHPATGYSIVRSISEAPSYADAISAALRCQEKIVKQSGQLQLNSKAAALEAWNTLWPMERKRQRAFFIFGLEVLLQQDLEGMRTFFRTFFYLPEWMWKGFLGSKLSSVELLWFAVMTFMVAPNSLRYQLVRQLFLDPSGAVLLRAYLGL